MLNKFKKAEGEKKVYSGKTLLRMMESEKKSQIDIAQVKGLKGGHKSGRIKFPVRTEDKLYLENTITKLKSLSLQRHSNGTS